VRVVIDNAALRRNRSCKGAYTSPEWDESAQALVYSDWDATVKRLLDKGQLGADELEWFIHHKLVPMTMAEFIAAKAAHGVHK
jgi:hypothetical protein